MYFLRTDVPVDFLIWLMMSLGWCIGGWLLVQSIFRLRQREQLFTGIALGMTLFIVISNLLGYIVGLPLAYWCSALLILVLGIGAMRFTQSGLPIKNRRDLLPAIVQIGIFMGILYLYGLINRGLAIFDDFYNLPLVSRIAAGDFPPHYFLYPEKPMPLHYGLHLLGASLVRIGGLFPWSGFDLSKALSQTLVIVLSWLWFRRCTHSRIAASLGSALVLFGSGARWLLRLLPDEILFQISQNIHLLGSGAESGKDLITALHSPWNISGDGPIPFSFSFANGLFPPATMALSSSGAMPLMTLFLLLLLGINRKRFSATTITGIVLASLALTGEHYYIALWVGIVVILIIRWWNRKHRNYIDDRKFWFNQIWLLTIAAILGIPFGGVITEMAKRGLALLGGSEMVTGFGLHKFALRWYPALVSAHLGELSFFSPSQLLVIICEMGPIFLLAPVVTISYFRRAHNRPILSMGMVIAAIIAFLAGSFLIYEEREREISRMIALALSMWMVLGFPLLWQYFKKGKLILKLLIGIGYLVALISGVKMFMVECNAANTPQLTDFATRIDAQISKRYWNVLPEGVQIFDRIPYRAITLFGRTGGNAYLDNYTPTPEWLDLLSNLDPIKAAQMGYHYIYLDNKTRAKLSTDEMEALSKECVRQVIKVVDDVNKKESRMLLDIQNCYPVKTSP